MGLQGLTGSSTTWMVAGLPWNLFGSVLRTAFRLHESFPYAEFTGGVLVDLENCGRPTRTRSHEGNNLEARVGRPHATHRTSCCADGQVHSSPQTTTATGICPGEVRTPTWSVSLNTVAIRMHSGMCASYLSLMSCMHREHAGAACQLQVPEWGVSPASE